MSFGRKDVATVTFVHSTEETFTTSKQQYEIFHGFREEKRGHRVFQFVFLAVTFYD